MTRPATLPTLLNRARVALRKAEVAADAQRRADGDVRIEAGRQALAAMSRRGIERKSMIEIVETHARRWNPDRYRLERIEVWPTRNHRGEFTWRGLVSLTAFNARGKALLTPIQCSWDLKHPRDLAKMIRKAKESKS